MTLPLSRGRRCRRTADEEVIIVAMPRAGLDGPSVPIHVEPVKLPDVSPAREAPAEPAPATPPTREPEEVPA